MEVLQKATVYDGKEKNRNWKVNEVNKNLSAQSVGQAEIFLDSEHWKNGERCRRVE